MSSKEMTYWIAYFKLIKEDEHGDPKQTMKHQLNLLPAITKNWGKK